MIPGKNYTSGSCVYTMIHDCFKPDIDVQIYREDSPEGEDIYAGKAADLTFSILRQCLVVDMWWDFYYLQFTVVVK